jgi:hypothetical protein
MGAIAHFGRKVNGWLSGQDGYAAA